MSRDHDPLDREERALADALARATPRAGPPPAVDAAILASARRAVQAGGTTGTRRPRTRRRWPAALGVAASLALAVGIAWQLRPAPDAVAPAVGEGPPAVFDAPPPAPLEPAQADGAPVHETGAPPASEPAVEPPPVREPAPPAPAAMRAAPPVSEKASEPASVEESAEAQAAPAPPAQPAPAATPATAPPPAPASQAENRQPVFKPSALPVDTAIGRERIRQDASGQAAPARAALPAPSAPESTAAASRATAGDIVFEHEGLDDEPPATVDSPQARRAWLDRIRELREAGELDAARESLREYRRRYPGLDLPGDLEGLLSE